MVIRISSGCTRDLLIAHLLFTGKELSGKLYSCNQALAITSNVGTGMQTVTTAPSSTTALNGGNSSLVVSFLLLQAQASTIGPCSTSPSSTDAISPSSMVAGNTCRLCFPVDQHVTSRCSHIADLSNFNRTRNTNYENIPEMGGFRGNRGSKGSRRGLKGIYQPNNPQHSQGTNIDSPPPAVHTEPSAPSTVDTEYSTSVRQNQAPQLTTKN